MMKLSEYLQEPCRKSAIPHWKTKQIKMPDNMLVIHNDDFSKSYLRKYDDEIYFRLYHNLKNIIEITNNSIDLIEATPNDIPALVSIINKSYTDISVNKKQLLSYTQSKVYRPGLWILAKDKFSKRYVGAGIAEFDDQAKELVLEWIQVIPEFQRRKIAQSIVLELLHRGQEYADFATVSGKIDNQKNLNHCTENVGFLEMIHGTY